jgi:hypothetical protein
MMDTLKIGKPFFGSTEFIMTARLAVLDVVRSQLDPTDNVEIGIDDVYEVTHGYILGNQKAMISTSLTDGKYYEVTYDATKQIMYIDCYVKFNQRIVGIELSE